MTYATVCSGIEAPSVAWEPLGWKPVWFSEIAPFPRRLLKHRFPHVPNLGNMLTLAEQPFYHDSTFDLLCGGTPCQSFSLAGLRGGLDDARGNLALQFCRVLDTKRPRWFVWENVPGVLSSFSGEAADGVPVWQTSDFATLLLAFQECGYSCGWRVLDSQYFGVPQQRRRVFVVGHLGDDWRPPAAVLLEPEGLRRDPAPGGEGEGEAAPAAARGIKGGSKPHIAGTLMATVGKQRKDDTYVVMTDPGWPAEKTSTLNAHFGDKWGLEDQHINGGATLFVPQLFEQNSLTSKSWSARELKKALCKSKNHSHHALIDGMYVRRLTPTECERLQGFPDGWTALTRGSDAARYMALGNSMTTKVMGWLGRRIDFVDRLLHPEFYQTAI